MSFGTYPAVGKHGKMQNCRLKARTANERLIHRNAIASHLWRNDARRCVWAQPLFVFRESLLACSWAVNGFIFIMVGLQLPGILRALSHEPLARLTTYAIVISATVVLVRIA